MKKRGKGKTINFSVNLTNRWLYTFIALGILIVVSVGVFAAVNKAGAYHDSQTIEVTINGVTKSLQEAINEGDLARDTRCDGSGNCNAVYANDLYLDGVRLESWPESQIVCPDGTSLILGYLSEIRGDTYGTPTIVSYSNCYGISSNLDTCHRDLQNTFTCPVNNNTASCVDYYVTSSPSAAYPDDDDEFDYICRRRTVTCVNVAAIPYCG